MFAIAMGFGRVSYRESKDPNRGRTDQRGLRVHCTVTWLKVSASLIRLKLTQQSSSRTHRGAHSKSEQEELRDRDGRHQSVATSEIFTVASLVFGNAEAVTVKFHVQLEIFTSRC